MLKKSALIILACTFGMPGISSGERDGNTKAASATAAGEEIVIRSKISLAHLGSLDSFEITEAGTQAGKFMLDYLEQGDTEALKLALAIYQRLIPRENYGGEYSAIQWFGEYILSSDEEKKDMLSDRYVKSFFDYMTKDDYAVLIEFIKTKYKLTDKETTSTKETIDRERWLEDFILFNNPKREEWEKTSKIVDVMNIKEGDSIVDVGCGPGFYSFKFRDMVGDSGRVFSVDTNKTHLDYMQALMDKYELNNIELVHTRANTIGVPVNVADLVTMVSLYHIVYMTSTEEVKDSFIDSIKRAMKPDATLVIVDNAALDEEGNLLPYHGPHIAKELIIAQLKYYGFDLVEHYSFIPQRYILKFKLREQSTS